MVSIIMKTEYAMTIKIIEKNYWSSEKDLLIVMSDMLRAYKGELINYVFEKDSIGRLHLHGTFRARKGLRYTLFKRDYCHLHVSELKESIDYEKWQEYIMKDQK